MSSLINFDGDEFDQLFCEIDLDNLQNIVGDTVDAAEKTLPAYDADQQILDIDNGASTSKVGNASTTCEVNPRLLNVNDVASTSKACENSEQDFLGLFEEHPFLLDLMVEQEEEEKEEIVSGSVVGNIDSLGNNLQTGGGVGDGSCEDMEIDNADEEVGEPIRNYDENVNHLIVLNEKSRRYKRFNLTGREISVKIQKKPPNLNIDLIAWLDECMKELQDLLLAPTLPNDFIGIEIQANGLSKPLWMSFRPVDKFNYREILTLIESASQSSSSFDVASENLNVTASVVTVPAGRGRVPLSVVSRQDVRKNSILKIKRDRSCLARSLCVSYVYERRGQVRSGKLHEKWHEMRQENGLKQKSSALKLERDAGVNVPEIGCGPQEIHQFQIYFANMGVCVIVYDSRTFGSGGNPIYNGTEFLLASNIDILYTLKVMYFPRLNHYRPILNLKAVAGSRNYCIPCNKKYEHYHRCSNRCYRCKQIPPCAPVQQAHLVDCPDCNRQFFGKICFDKHKPEICASMWHCHNCLRTVKSTDDDERQHKCDEIFCKICLKRVNINHYCFMQPIAKRPEAKRPNVIFLFYDFETQQSETIEGDRSVKIHRPNLCIVHQVCTFCINDFEGKLWCDKCGVHEYKFDREPVKQFVDLALDRRTLFSKVICLAQNSQGFDAQFILKYIVEVVGLEPKLILNGTKIVLMTLENVKFIDSLNYFHMPLSALPKAFGFPDTTKGTFPHLFNRPENINYRGPLPDKKYYSPDSMSCNAREKFLSWHDEMSASGYVFNFEEEIVRYCREDVKILKLACIAFRKSFLENGKVCPFTEATTIASTCMRVYRKNFLKPYTIGILPNRGYRFNDNQSAVALKWLVWMESELNRNIFHAGRCREIKLPINVKVDGFSDPRPGETFRGICLQFYGCYWHGCYKCYRINRDVAVSENCTETLEDRYTRTLAIANRIRANNYQLHEIWECDFNRDFKEREEMREYVSRHSLTKYEPLNVRDAFYGGRTENFVKLYETREGEKIKYVDVTSLYPFICKRGEFPVGHPKLYVGLAECKDFAGENYENFSTKVNGIVYCKVLPPRDLLHPVLPVKMHNKLLFALCRVCCEEMSQEACTHDDENMRCFTGTWVSLEIKKAIEMGYVIREIYEIWHYRKMTQYNQATKTGGLFAEYIDTFYKLKTEASGFPSECTDEASIDAYIENVKVSEGIELEREKIQKNMALRGVAKLCLNSLWGFFGQQENKLQTKIIRDPAELQALLACPMTEVAGVLPVNDNVLYLSMRTKEGSFEPLNSANVVLAAYVTAQARLKLYSYLEHLGPSSLYCDTDSVLYVTDEQEGSPDLQTGPLLGDLTNELEGYGPNAYITCFVSGGPKFYAQTIRKDDGTYEQVCKVKGIRLNYQNSNEINFDSVKSLVREEIDAITVNDNHAIRRTKFHDVISKKESKVCKTVYTKRRFVNDSFSLPFGHI